MYISVQRSAVSAGLLAELKACAYVQACDIYICIHMHAWQSLRHVHICRHAMYMYACLAELKTAGPLDRAADVGLA